MGFIGNLQWKLIEGDEGGRTYVEKILSTGLFGLLLLGLAGSLVGVSS